MGFQSGAFSQLTTKYMDESFNPSVPDDPNVSYFSYGAAFEPRFYNIYYASHRIIQEIEGPNDGLVSVESARWGTYEGTLVGVNHLSIINWVNRVGFAVGNLFGVKRDFNALAFYCAITGELYSEWRRELELIQCMIL